MSAYKIDAILHWQAETETRQTAIRDAEQHPGEDDDSYAARLESMPQPRTWLQFAIDPLEDGAPRSAGSDSPGMLNENDPLNADSLLLDPSWSQASVGENFDTVYFYKQAQKGRQSWSDRIIESVYPSIVHKTAAGDFVPSLWNLFQNKDGSRYEGHEVGTFTMRTAYHAGGAVWNLLMVAGIAVIGSYAIRKALPNLAAAAVDTIDESLEVTLGD
jgi:hypothetical protein